MAYNDYGAFVWCNGERRTDKEDAPLFASSDETFGADINSIPSGARIFVALMNAKQSKKPAPTGGAPMRLYHGVLGDNAIRVGCYKQGLPSIWEMTDNEPQRVRYFDCVAVQRAFLLQLGASRLYGLTRRPGESS